MQLRDSSGLQHSFFVPVIITVTTTTIQVTASFSTCHVDLTCDRNATGLGNNRFGYGKKVTIHASCQES